MVHDGPDVEREATRQGDRELVGLREARGQRGSDESVGARQMQRVALVVVVIIRRGEVTSLPQAKTALLRLGLTLHGPLWTACVCVGSVCHGCAVELQRRKVGWSTCSVQ